MDYRIPETIREELETFAHGRGQADYQRDPKQHSTQAMYAAWNDIKLELQAAFLSGWIGGWSTERCNPERVEAIES